MNLWYALRSGKNPKFVYYAQAFVHTHWPAAWLKNSLPRKLAALEQRPDKEDILRRVDYYNRLSPSTPVDMDLWQQKAICLKDQPMTPQKVYYLDAMEYARYFDPALRWLLIPSDVTFIPSIPSIVKSRPISEDNANSVILKLNKVRHFIFVNDRIPFQQKRDQVLFRNRISRGMPSFIPQLTGDTLRPPKGDGGKGAEASPRLLFMQKYFGHPLVDAGAIDHDLDQHPLWNPQWQCEKMTIPQQLHYKFIMAIEGNEVASNLKWVMSSNSIAVCPRPRYETWFMEGQLRPDYHYIEVAPDFSDLPDKLQFYLDHPTEAEAILRHAHEWVDQFRDRSREDLISLLVLEKYFRMTPP